MAVVGDRAAGRAPFSALRVYFGPWSVTDGKTRMRKGPIAPDERADARRAMDGLPLLAPYCDCLARGDAAIADCFEPDGCFREPAGNHGPAKQQVARPRGR